MPPFGQSVAPMKIILCNKTDVERTKTLDRVRSINPQYNQPLLRPITVYFICLYTKQYIFCICILYQVSCQLSSILLLCWLFVDSYGSVVFPVLLPINVKINIDYRNELCRFPSIINSSISCFRAICPAVLRYWWVSDIRDISYPMFRSNISL